MINRLLIRIKVLQILYNYYRVEGMGIPGAIGLLRYALEQSYRLYFYLVGIPLDLAEKAEQRLLVEEEKFHKDESVIKLLKHMVSNPLVDVIAADEAYKEERERIAPTSAGFSDFYSSLLLKALSREELKTLDWTQLPEVRKAWRSFYGDEILQSELYHDLLEDTNTFLNDDIGIVFTFVTKAYNGLKSDVPFSDQLKPAFASEEDEDFGPVLIEQAILNGSEYRDLISKYFKNWDKERVSEMDYIIMQLAVTEAVHFPLIPTRVTINEYLNLAHYYSSPNSNSYINGILHELFGDLKKEGRIVGE